MTERYDVLVIGAGPAGLAAAQAAASHGARVGICEDYRVGGTCVIRGCVPKKLLVYGSKFAHEFEDAAAYAKWYGHEHHALELQKEAVYGLVELYRRDIKKARLVANPGCYTSCAILPLVPLPTPRPNGLVSVVPPM